MITEIPFVKVAMRKWTVFDAFCEHIGQWDCDIVSSQRCDYDRCWQITYRLPWGDGL